MVAEELGGCIAFTPLSKYESVGTMVLFHINVDSARGRIDVVLIDVQEDEPVRNSTAEVWFSSCGEDLSVAHEHERDVGFASKMPDLRDTIPVGFSAEAFKLSVQVSSTTFAWPASSLRTSQSDLLPPEETTAAGLASMAGT